MTYSSDKNEQMKKYVSDCFKTGRIPHALIIEGSDREQRMGNALYFAKSLLCSGDEKPCGKCPNCKKTEAGFHSDLEVFEGSGKSEAVSIEDVRKIINDAYIIPNEAERKVFIVCNAQKMNEYAQNALLKCLEEPPSYVAIILECEDKGTLLETVRSRSAYIRLGEAEDRKISQAKEEKLRVLAENMAKAITEPSEAPLMSLLGQLEKDKNSLKLCIREMTEILRDCAVFKSTGNTENLISFCPETAKEISHFFTEAQFFMMINKLTEIDELADRNANNSLLLSKMCYELRRCAGR